MNRTVIALLVVCSPAVLADDGFYLNLSSTFHTQADSALSHAIGSFWETGVGLGYKEPWSAAWDASYELGVTTAKPEYSGVGDVQSHSLYTRILFEYNELSDSVKPFAGVELQKSSIAGNNDTEMKPFVGLSFYPEQKNYSVSLQVSGSD